MASLRVLAFDPEGKPVAFDTWHDDLQLYLLSDLKDSVSLFEHVSGAAPAPPATADVLTRSQWLSRDATACLAIRNHLPATECAHFEEHRTAQALYDAVVARYSSSATAAIRRLLLPYLFPELSAFATVADLVTHMRTSDARYRATVPAEFFPTNQPPMFITLYFIVTRLPDSLRSVRDHFLTLDPTSLTVDLLEQHLLAAETCGTPRSPFFEGTLVLLRLVQSAATARARVAGVVEEAVVVVEVAVGAVVGAAVEEVEAVEVVAGVGPVAEVEALVAAVEAAEGVVAVEAVGPVVVGLDLNVEALRGAGEGSETCPYVIRMGAHAGRTCGRFHTERHCFACLDDAWRNEFDDDVERPRWAQLLQSGVAIFDLDFDVIISAMYALSFSAEGDCYRCVPPDPVIAAAALGASASGTPPGTAPAEALHTFMLDSGASRCFFRESTTLTPLPAPVPARMADPSRGPVVASSSTVLASCVDLHVHTDGASPGYVHSSARVESVHAGYRASSGRSVCSGHPSQPRLCGMHSRLLVSGLPRSLPPLPPSPAPPCLPCIEGRQRAAPHSSSFPPTSAPLQTLHMDVWGPARVSGQGLHLQLSERFGQDLPVLRLHSDRGGEFSSDLLREFCHGEGITQSLSSGPVSLPETSPTLRWTGKVGDASVFWVWGSRAFVCDTSADKLTARAIPCPVPFYHLFPYRSAPPLPLPLFLAPGPPPVAVVSGSGLGTASGGAASGGAASGGAEPGGAGSEGAGSGGAEPEGVEPGGAESEGAEPGGAELEGAESGGAEPRGAASSGGPASASPRLSSQQLREWLVQRAHRWNGAPGVGEPGDAGAGGAVVTTGAGDPTELGAAGAGGTGGTVRPRLYFVPLLQQVLGVPSSTGLPPPLLCPPPDQSQPPLQPASPLPVPSPYTEQSGGLTEHREPASPHVSPVPTTRRAPCLRPPPVPGTHTMALRPSSVPLCVPLPTPPESSLLEVPDPDSDRACAASPTVARLLATAVTHPSFESAAVSALVAEVLDFAPTPYCCCSTMSGMGLVLGGRGPVVLTGHADASWVDDSATQRSSQGYTFSLGSGSVSWQSTRSSLVLSSSCEAEIYARAMATQELRWLTYLLTDLGEQPCSSPLLYVDNKAMIALCQEHRLEHRTKHIALRYFLARELQQRG
ncbi:unnamed protein product [Closterium sp. NIES-54]